MGRKESPALKRLAAAGLSYKHVKVNLVGHDGNAFAVLGTVTKALRKAGASKDVIEVFVEEATEGNYDDLLLTVFKWVTVTGHCECCGHDLVEDLS